MNYLDMKMMLQKAVVIKNASEKERDELIFNLDSLFSDMKEAGVNDEQDINDYFFIKTNLDYVPVKDKKAALKSIFLDRTNNPVNTELNLKKAINKMAYPQDNADNILPQRSITKWIQALSNISLLRNKGIDKISAFNQITKDWENTEKLDFKTWSDFYMNGEHLKYKLAQYLPADGVVLPHSLRSSLPVPNPVVEEKVQQYKPKDRKQQLLARLNAAEKIFQDEEFRRSLGTNYMEWLEILHKLKRMIQASQIRTIATFNALLVKEATVLLKDKTKLSLINKIAQTVELPSEAPPGEGEEEKKSDPKGAIKDFLKNLIGESDYEEDKKDMAAADDDCELSVDDSELVRTAQIAPVPEPPIKPAPVPIPKDIKPAPVPNETVELEIDEPVTENALIQPEDVGGSISDKESEERTDDAIDAAFSNVKLNDVIVRLDGLASMYRHRQMARELSIVDLMMQALGISSFFPNLAEATKSALDSNQYVLSRVEDVLAKLRGASSISDGSLDSLINKLEKSEDSRENKRIEKSLEEMNGPETPAVEAPLAPPPPKEASPASSEALREPVAIQPNPAPIKV